MIKENAVVITGQTLIDLGFKPGKWFKEAIAYANENKLAGVDLFKYLSETQPTHLTHEIIPYSDSVSYSKNIEATTEEEQQNLTQVFNSMDELMKTPTVVTGCVMPDACPTGEVGQIPVGGVVVTLDTIHPSMHSADICCSVMLTSFGKTDPKLILDTAHLNTHFGPGGRFNNPFQLPEDLENKIRGNKFLNSEKSLHLAKSHLGTQGDGNHFLFVGTNNAGETCMVTHHGSRGLGAQLYKEGMRVAEKFRQKLSPKTLKRNAWIPYNSEEGKEYWDALQIIREWTKLNHTLLHKAVCMDLGIPLEELKETFWNEHNFVFKAEKNNQTFFVHAKGATPLIDQFVPDSHSGLRIIPLNMAQPILIVKGEATESNLGFAPHGAGRNISRSQHKRNNSGKTSEEILKEETEGLDIRFFSNTIDISELPSAYKNAADVRNQMQKFGLGEVVDEIKPYGCIMAGDFTGKEPWRKNKL